MGVGDVNQDPLAQAASTYEADLVSPSADGNKDAPAQGASASEPDLDPRSFLFRPVWVLVMKALS